MKTGFFIFPLLLRRPLCIAAMVAGSVIIPSLPFAVAEDSDVNRLMVLAYRYYTGTGKPVNYAKALNLYRQAAMQGDKEAQFIVGGMYYRGLATDPDAREAFKWFLRAAEQGRSTVESRYIIGSMYLRGTGVPINYVEAGKWLEQSAAQGNLKAQNDLAFIYYNGLGCKRDFTRALQLYTDAAMQGDSQAQNNVGLLYATGTGVARDTVKAYAWYSLAASQGNTAAMIGRNSLMADMSWDELNSAQALSVELYQQVERNRELKGWE